MAKKKVEGMPWGQLERRLFAQGGWVHKDEQQRVISVILKPIKNRLLQLGIWTNNSICKEVSFEGRVQKETRFSYFNKQE